MKTVADLWFDPFRNRDADALEATLTEDFIHTSPFGEFKGRKTYLDLVRANTDAFFNHTIEIVDVIEMKDKSAVRYIIDGRPCCDCIYLRDGKISAIHAYYHFGPKPTL